MLIVTGTSAYPETTATGIAPAAGISSLTTGIAISVKATI